MREGLPPTALSNFHSLSLKYVVWKEIITLIINLAICHKVLFTCMCVTVCATIRNFSRMKLLFSCAHTVFTWLNVTAFITLV